MNNPDEPVKNILQSDTTNDGSLSSPDTFSSLDLYGASVRGKEESDDIRHCFHLENESSGGDITLYRVFPYSTPFSCKIAFIKNSSACCVSKHATSKYASSMDTLPNAFFACSNIAADLLYIVLIYHNPIFHCFFHNGSLEIVIIHHICMPFCNIRNLPSHISGKWF